MFAHERAVESIQQAQELSRTRYFWMINYLTDYTEFDFLYEPVPWEADQAHVWPSQHQSNGSTWLVPKQGYTDVNRNHSVLLRNKTVPVIGIDHGNGLDIECDYQTRFISDYLGTLRRVLSKVNEEYVWVVSSVCSYDNFDFTWHPSEWQQDMLHVFPSYEQKFGDTFYVHVPSFLKKSENLKLLEWFDTIHFVEDRMVPRHPTPIVEHTYDSQVSAIWEHEFTSPVVQFTTHHAENLRVPMLNLWRQETRAVMPLSPGASTVIVPREAKNFIKKQLYDYPVIDKNCRTMLADKLLDIVFISNGEPNAEEHWAQLQLFTSNSQRVVRVDGVNGRAAAYHAAANASTTPWFFAVFAKLSINPVFDWSWQPDRLQQPKHYIFHARNPVNDLEYGHQAMIAYNKNLVLSNPGRGLDFTLDDAHEVVPILSGTAYYDKTPWMAWRTAFREVLKLRASLPDVENEYRINRWCAEGNGVYAQWSSMGARDAVEYFQEVNGEFDALKKSYEWEWLASYAFIKHNLTPDQ